MSKHFVAISRHLNGTDFNIPHKIRYEFNHQLTSATVAWGKTICCSKLIIWNKNQKMDRVVSPATLFPIQWQAHQKQWLLWLKAKWERHEEKKMNMSQHWAEWRKLSENVTEIEAVLAALMNGSGIGSQRAHSTHTKQRRHIRNQKKNFSEVPHKSKVVTGSSVWIKLLHYTALCMLKVLKSFPLFIRPTTTVCINVTHYLKLTELNTQLLGCPKLALPHSTSSVLHMNILLHIRIVYAQNQPSKQKLTLYIHLKEIFEVLEMILVRLLWTTLDKM